MKAFLKEVDAELLRLINASNRAGWVQSTYITPDTEVMAAQANEALVTAATNYAKESFRFDKVQVSPVERRQLNLLKNSLTIAAPPDPKEGEELTRLVASMEGTYGSGKFCSSGTTKQKEAAAPPEKDCLDIEKITEILAENRDPKRLQEVWEGWHTVSPPMRKDYARFVELSNKGANVLGFKDTGAMWRGKYDMPADDFAKELDRLWEQLRPLYMSLHTYVRGKLHEKYGAAVPENGPIPAHLLGNLWQQDWSNIYDIVGPANQKDAYSLTDHPEGEEARRHRHGAYRRTLLHVARLRAAAEDVLRTVAVRASRRIARSCVTPAPGTSTRWTTCASRCASTSTRKTSSRSITSSGTTSISAPTARSRSCSATAPTTASTKRSAIRSRSR